jgi:hypothetical protein
MEEITIEEGNYGTWRGWLGARSEIDGAGRRTPAFLLRQTSA